jgi:4-hydroxybenzoate polyprenyltransferase
LVYPFLKFYTYWAQLGGAVLMACVVPTAWVACAASSEINPVSSISTSIAMALSKNGPLLVACFLLEVLFSFIHETVYGCQVCSFDEQAQCHRLIPGVQDTPEDMELGIYSVSILFGYETSKRVVFSLTFVYLGLLGYALRIAGLHWIVISVVPAYVLVSEAYRVKMDDPASCGKYARRGIFVKIGICASVALDLAFIHAQSGAITV